MNFVSGDMSFDAEGFDFFEGLVESGLLANCLVTSFDSSCFELAGCTGSFEDDSFVLGDGFSLKSGLGKVLFSPIGCRFAPGE